MTYVYIRYKVRANVEEQYNPRSQTSTPSGCVDEICHIKGILYFDDLYITGLE
jgi:hypothetical protein